MVNKKIKAMVCYILAAAMVLSIFPITVFAAITDNAGSNNDPYRIGTAEELLWFSQQMNSYNIGSGCYAILTDDIDMSSVCSSEKGASWTPINGDFKGSFDGCGHVIKNLYINNPEADNQGLFGNPDRATIKNLGLLDCNIIGADKVGGIVGGSDYTIVSNCFVTGTVSGNDKVGGIYGSIGNTAAVNNISAAEVSGKSNVGIISGSLIGTQFSNSCGLKYNNIPLFGSQSSAAVENVVEFDDFSEGEACYFMNGNSSVYPTWFQNIGEGGDECPVLDSTHGVIYKTDSGYAMCNEHSKDGDGFCSICGCYLPDGLEPNADNFFEIDTAKKLLWFSYCVNHTDKAANAMLTSDIDLSTLCGNGIGSWKTIGNSSVNYNGTFDGNNHTISNLYINDLLNSTGLFGRVESQARITDIAIENADITGSGFVGILVGYNSGLISHCSVDGSITAVGNSTGVGGVCGTNSLNSTITDCYNKATISVTGSNNSVGGVCGKNLSAYIGKVCIGTVKNSINTGSVTATGDGNKVGPVVGNDNNITYSVVTGNYYLDTSETDLLTGTTFKTEAQFKSGEVAYLLDNGVTDGTQPWYQNCHVGYPEISGETVYRCTNCKSEYEYTNDASLSGLQNQHIYNNGICTVCDKHQAAVLKGGVYEIENAGQLKWFAALVNGDTTLTGGIAKNQSANVVLLSDIKYSENNDGNHEGYAPIISSFSGTFDGNGFTISKTDSIFVASLLDGGEIKNLTISDQRIWPGGACGGIVGTNSGIIENCIVNNPYMQVSGWDGFGGIVGKNSGTIRNCAVIGGTMMLRWSAANNPGGYSMGGISGVNSGKIEDCYFYNTALRNGVTHSAIVFDEKEGGTISNCYYYSHQTYKVDDTTAGGTAQKAAQFNDGSVAWLLNTADGTKTHTGIWSQGTVYPILANDENKAIYKVTLDGQPSYAKGTYAFPNDSTKYYIVSDDENTYNNGDVITLSKDIVITSYSIKPEIVSATNSSALISAPNNITATLIFASYKDGKLLSFDVQKNISITQGTKTYHPTASFNSEGADKVIVMLWENAESMKPLCETVTIYLLTNAKIISAAKSSALIYTPNTITATLVFAAYKDGKLLSFDVQKNISITGGAKTYYPTASFNSEGADKVTVMLWEKFESMKPLCEAVTA